MKKLPYCLNTFNYYYSGILSEFHLENCFIGGKLTTAVLLFVYIWLLPINDTTVS